MTELTAGAVSSLLVVIHNEALLLGGVRNDVQFIKEEMESMNSFLAHLARSAPPGAEHDEQVRTWMNQVRLLAQDCNNCIDLYLYSGNPDIHRAKGRLRRYLWWVYWSLRKLLAQHRAAVQLRELKDRARDVGERRLRYGVEVPGKKSAGQATSLSESENAAAALTLEDDEQAHHSGQRVVFERRTLDDYVKTKLLKWASEIPPCAGETLSIAIVAPHADKHVLALARDILVWDHIGYQRGILVNIPEVHLEFLPLQPKEVLYYILRQLKNDISRSQKQSIDQCYGEEEEEEEEAALGSWRDFRRKTHIYHAKERVINKIKENIENMKINEKLDKINSYIQVQQEKGNQQQLLDLNLGQKKGVDTVQNRKDVDQVDRLGALFHLLFMSQQDQVTNKNMNKSSMLDDSIIMKIAKKLKKYIEEDEMADKLMEQRGKKGKEKETDKQGKVEERKDEEKDEKRFGGREMGDEREEEKGVREKREDERKKGEKNGVDERDLVDERNEGEQEKGVGEEMRDEREEKSVGQGEIGEDEMKESRENKEKRVGGEVGNKRRKEEGGEVRSKKEEGKMEGEKEREKKKGGKAEGGTMEEKGEDDGKELKEVGNLGEEQKKDHKDNEDEEEDDEDEDDDDEEEDEDDDDEEEVEDDDEESQIYLDEDQYAQILREVFLKPSSSKPLHVQQQANQTTITTLDEDRIKQMIHEAKQEVIRELKEDKQDNKDQTIDESGAPDQNQDKLNEIAATIEIIKKEIKEQLKIKGIVDKIKHHLNLDKIKRHLKHNCPLIILKVDEMMDGSRWEEIRKALSLLKCSADALIFTSESIQQAKGYCYPKREPIDYSFAGLNHDTVLELTRQQMDEDKYSPQILHDILEACEPHEFCMKIFTHALYVNPKRSNEELCKLRSTLRAIQPKSFNSIAKVMFKFSYNDLPKEYKSCLLYLAIFPPEYKIRRSTLIGRWVAEGLTLKEDWPSSVLHAYQCFDALIRRCLVYPADIGATGNVKSCIIGDLFHGFITTIARKQHIVETRLSHHLARHFSIFNNLHLRSSDRIHKFFQGPSKSSGISMLKVLDLEDCQCFGGKNQRYLKDICSKMLLLKYLSLKGTDITYLPREINNLRELEILDIRQTKVPEDATANILLLKLKRLLAGNIDPTEGNFTSSVRVPHRIEKMVNIEILSNVKAKHRDDFKDIGKLWQLRKLGVVIEDKASHLGHLLRTISDLHECLRSLSITLPVAAPHGGTPSTVELQEDTGSCLHECLHSLSITLPVAAPQGSTPSAEELPADIVSRLRHHPKILESLSISGTTAQGHLLPLFKRGDNNTLAKVTLSHTLLDKKDLDMLAELPRLRCVRLKHIACTEPMLTFKGGEFRSLKYLLVEGTNLNDITFEGGAAQLEKIVLSFTSTGSISGADKLPKLEEVELNSRLCGELLPSFVRAKEIAKVTLCGTLLKQDALQILANKPSMRCLVLSDMSFDGTQNQITFNKDEFIWLNLLVVDCSTITKIVFATGSAPRLEKITWSSPTSLSGIDNLPRLKELEFNGVLVPTEVEEVIKNKKDKLKIKHNKPETQDQAKGDEQEYDEDAGRFSLCWK